MAQNELRTDSRLIACRNNCLHALSSFPTFAIVSRSLELPFETESPYLGPLPQRPQLDMSSRRSGKSESRSADKKSVTVERQEKPGKREKGEESVGKLPSIPEDILPSGKGTYLDGLKERFADICFATFVVLLVASYVCMRLEFSLMTGDDSLDSNPTVKQGMAVTLAVVLAAISRRSKVAAACLDQTVGMAVAIGNLARRQPAA